MNEPEQAVVLPDTTSDERQDDGFPGLDASDDVSTEDPGDAAQPAAPVDRWALRPLLVTTFLVVIVVAMVLVFLFGISRASDASLMTAPTPTMSVPIPNLKS